MGGAVAEDLEDGRDINRRNFLKFSALSGALVGFGPSMLGSRRASTLTQQGQAAPSFEWEESTITDLQAAMRAGELTSRELTRAYIERIHDIDWSGPQLNSVIEINPDAVAIAQQLDSERRQGHTRGPLHGIPILLKDNIATADGMETTAGSFALLGSVPPRDAFVARQLRRAGAVILGKTNPSEWANFRSFQSSSGWSARAGQCLNPYVLSRNPSGSSSGSGTAVAANLAPAALGTETDGSIVSPSAANSLVGIKVTLGLTSRSGVVPLAHSQDVVGPMARTVSDAATVLGAIVGIDRRDRATRASSAHFRLDYRPFLRAGALQGARIGVWRRGVFGYSPEGDRVANRAISSLRDLGASVVDPANIPNVSAVYDAEFTVLLYEFKHDLRNYLSQLTNKRVHNLNDVIQFNAQHADLEMPWFGQEIFRLAAKSGPLTDPVYLNARRRSRRVMRRAISDVMEEHKLDAIVSLTGEPPWTTDLVNGDHFLTSSSTPTAVAGFPNITVPAGYDTRQLPVGISFMGKAWQEPKLIALAYSFEQGTKKRHAPKFLPSLGSIDFVSLDERDVMPSTAAASSPELGLTTAGADRRSRPWALG
jgi:amidase